jgi:methylthioribose-1-phosphate isomerase
MWQRQDHDLAFLLRYENVAWYDGQTVRILDRRIYPARVEYVTCGTWQEVAAAIRDMVTQSGGPSMAAGMGMALAARQIEAEGAAGGSAAGGPPAQVPFGGPGGLSSGRAEQLFAARIARAAYELSHARPTTSAKIAAITEACAAVAMEAKAAGRAPDKAVFDHTLALTDARYARSAAQATYLVDKIPDDATLMTQCFAETDVGAMLRECRARGKTIKVICPETRPYFQGARLTASVVRDMDFDVTVITDNMPGYTMKAKHVDVFTSAADVICMDGHIVNKVGTFQIALAARYWGIPYFCTGSPNRQHPTIDTVKIEERDENDVLEAMGVRTAMQGVRGWYPAFDITPPELCAGIVTDKGIFPPYDLARYFDSPYSLYYAK